MKLVIGVPDEALEDALRLMEWSREHGFSSVVRIGGPHSEPVFAWRILSLSLELEAS